MRTMVVVSALALTCAALPAAQIDLGTLNRVGSAQLIGSTLQLTNGGSGQLSAAWYPTAMSTNNDLSFYFSYFAQGTGIWADGFTFAMQNAGSTAIGALGGNLGIHGIAGSFVYIGFDYYGYLQDTTNGATKNSIRIQTSASPYYVHVDSKSGVTPNIYTGTRYVWIDYKAGTHTMSMYYSDINIKPSSPFLSGTVDLAGLLGDDMYVGFTGASYMAGAVQNITQFDIAPEPTTGLVALGGLLAAVLLRRRVKRQA